MRVLVVEERQWSSQKEIAAALKGQKQIDLDFCDFTCALSALATNRFDICVIDACLGPQRQISTALLVKGIRKFFKGKMVAISNIAYSRFPLMRAGCQYECAKGRLPELLLKIANC